MRKEECMRRMNAEKKEELNKKWKLKIRMEETGESGKIKSIEYEGIKWIY